MVAVLPCACSEDARQHVAAELLKVRRRLLVYARSLTRDWDRADDLVQDVFLRALERAEQYERGTNFASWIFRVTRNHWISSLRGGRNQPHEDIDGLKLTVPQRQEDGIRFRELAVLVRLLPRENRLILLMAGLEGADARRDRGPHRLRGGHGQEPDEPDPRSARRCPMKFTKKSDVQVRPSDDLGPVPGLRWIDKTLIDVDRRYQREISHQGIRHINGILRDFEWRYFQVITVTPTRAGRFFAIDGQHRWAAAMRHPAIVRLPCLVLEEIDIRQQAKVFDVMNSKRLGISALTKFHAALAAGDPKATRVDYLCAEAGITILRTMPQGGVLPALSLVSVATVAKFLRCKDQFLIDVLTAMVEAWPDKANGFRASNVAAAILCAIDLGTQFDAKTMTAMLRRWNEHQEFLKAYTERTENGGILERLLAKRMVERYERENRAVTA